MIFLDATNETLDLTASVAGALHWTVSASQIVAGNGSAVPGTHGALVTAAAVTIAAAPAVTEHRQIGLITVCNAGTVANLATVRKMVGGTPYTLHSAMLAPRETLQYTIQHGFEVLRDTSQKTIKPPVSVSNIPFVKASLATQIAAQYASMWRATTLPAQGAVPAAAAICTNATLGAMPLPTRTGTQKRLLTGINLSYSALAAGGIIQDRLAHMGGLLGNVATAQTVNVDVSLLTNDLPARIGAADFSEVQWFMEWYTATGATAVTPVFQVTHGDGTTGAANIFNAGSTALPASVAASRRYGILATSGKPIKSIQSVTHPTTGTAGSYGVTAVRELGCSVGVVANRIEPVCIKVENAISVSDNACLTMGMLCSTTSTGTVYGSVQMAVVDA